jgi:hypothetical protein
MKLAAAPPWPDTSETQHETSSDDNYFDKHRTEAIHKLEWYARRWSIETFFKTLKSGCRIEDIRLTTTDRLAKCIALACATTWCIPWLTRLKRTEPEGSPAAVFTHAKMELLKRSSPTARGNQLYDLNYYIMAVARLGDYLARHHDPPPGTIVLWREFSRLADLVIGYEASDRNRLSTCG